MKQCSKCGITKPLTDFKPRALNKDGYEGCCHLCTLERIRVWKEANRETIRAKRKAYKQANKQILTKKRKEYSLKNKERIAKRKREYRLANLEQSKARRKAYTSKPETKLKVNKYTRDRAKTDIQFRLKCRLRSRLWVILKTSKGGKAGSAIKDLGCSVAELIAYLESKFEPWMNWDNYGAYSTEKRTWQIDHIIPLCKFDLTDREQFLKACHYTNLQPLGALENYKKNRF